MLALMLTILKETNLLATVTPPQMPPLCHFKVEEKRR